jgi:hypothetical protein
MPVGAVSFDTLASGPHEGGSYEEIDLGPHLDKLIRGANILAVEVHQAATNDADLVWDAELTYTIASQTHKVVSIAPSGNDVVVKFAGVPGYIYRVEAATNIPAAAWLTLATNTAPATATTNGNDVLPAGHWLHRDTNALVLYPGRYYRSARP